MPNRTVHFLHDKMTRWQLTYLVLCFVLAVSNGVTGYVAIDTSQNVNAQQQVINDVSYGNQVALCQLHDITADSVQSTQQFLEEPEQFPAFSDPKTLALIRAQQVQRIETLNALKDVECP